MIPRLKTLYHKEVKTTLKEKYGFKTNDFPNASKFGNQSISLPVHSNLKESDITYICETLSKYLG